jgi:hypothetical protein
VAHELEDQLAVVNQQPVLRQPAGVTTLGHEGAGEEMRKRVRKNGLEKARRDCERDYLERISRLFKIPQYRKWTRKDLLSFGETIFLIDGRN